MKKIVIYGSERMVYFSVDAEILEDEKGVLGAEVSDEEYGLILEGRKGLGIWYEVQRILRDRHREIIDEFNKTHGVCDA